MAWPADWTTGERITAARLKQWTDMLKSTVFPVFASPAAWAGIALLDSNGVVRQEILGNPGGEELLIGVGGTNAAYAHTKMSIRSNGNVGLGLGSTPPSYQLHLSSDSAGKPGTSTWTIVSDDAAKRAVRPFAEGLATIERLTPIRFQYNGTFGTPDGMEGIGFSAQSLEPVCPYMVRTVRTQNAGEEPQTAWKSVDLHALQFLMVNAVKELAAAQRRIEGRLDAALIP